MKILILLLVLLKFVSCKEEVKYKDCSSCNGIGKTVIHSDEYAEYKVESANYDEISSFLQSDYVYVFNTRIKNLSKEGGIFVVENALIFDDIGSKLCTGKDFINSGEEKIVKCTLKIDRKPHRFTNKVTPPKYVKSTDKVCHDCHGKGKVLDV